MDSELRRRATRSEQRQAEDEKHPPRICAFDDCTVEVAGTYCEDHDHARFEREIAADYHFGSRR